MRNRGELAEGWYDPATLQRAIQSTQDSEIDREPREPKSYNAGGRESAEMSKDDQHGGGSDSDDSIGPALPGQESKSRKGRAGPSIPNMQDLELKRGMPLMQNQAPIVY